MKYKKTSCNAKIKNNNNNGKKDNFLKLLKLESDSLTFNSVSTGEDKSILPSFVFMIRRKSA